MANELEELFHAFVVEKQRSNVLDYDDLLLQWHRLIREFPDERLKPPPLLTGDDLIAAGYPPGPRFSQILTAVEDAQLEGQLHTCGDAMQLVREKFPLH